MAGPSRNYYDLLGILPSATMVEVKRAYRAMARKHHPDFNPQDASATERFKELQEAYNVLRDAKARNRYDRTLGFSSSQWTESIDEKDDPVEDLRARRERARAEKRPDDFYYDEPLGPRSDAAKAAAEEMRRRIHRAEQQEFWKKAGASKANGAHFGRRDPAGAGGTGPAGAGGAGAAGAGAAGAGAAGAGAAGAGAAGAGTNGDNTAGPGAGTTSGAGAGTGASDASATSGSGASPNASGPQAQASAKAPPPPHAGIPSDAPGAYGGDEYGAPPGFLEGRASFWIATLLFVGLLGLSGVAFMREPTRAAYFAILAFGVLGLRLLLVMERRLERLERRFKMLRIRKTTQGAKRG